MSGVVGRMGSDGGGRSRRGTALARHGAWTKTTLTALSTTATSESRRAPVRGQFGGRSGGQSASRTRGGPGSASHARDAGRGQPIRAIRGRRQRGRRFTLVEYGITHRRTCVTRSTTPTRPGNKTFPSNSRTGYVRMTRLNPSLQGRSFRAKGLFL